MFVQCFRITKFASPSQRSLSSQEINFGSTHPVSRSIRGNIGLGEIGINRILLIGILSRKRVAAGPTIMKLLVFTMYFSGGMIPLYLVVKGVGLYGSRWALILPTLVDTYNLIIMRTAFAGVPDSLEESAKLDGANAWTILWRIMAPLVKPTVAVITLYYAVSHWNSWFNAMLFLRDKTQYPLQLILRQILIQNDTADMTAGADYLISETIQYATVVVATLPILCIYPFVQKFFAQGVMVGSVKG